MLGLRQGASENAKVAGELCADHEQRGFDFQQIRLYMVDGAKGLAAAVKKRVGEAASVQRCPLRERRNVLAHLLEERLPLMEQKLVDAWNKFGYEHARKALEDVRLDLEQTHPSAARSLAEGREEKMTLHRPGYPEKLRKTLFSTNLIESGFSVVEEK